MSESLFKYDPPHGIEVSGFRWLGGKKKVIPTSALTRNILCKTHNNALSDVDTAGSQAFNTFRKLSHSINMRSKPSTNQEVVNKYSMDGPLLERWFLKTLINMMFEEAYRIGPTLAEIGKPSTHLVEIAFGMRSFYPPCGLYHIFLHAPIYSTDRIEFAPFLMKADMHNMIGGLFSFRGFRFLLFFGKGNPPKQLTNVKLGETDLGNSTLYYRPPKIGFQYDNKPFEEIEILW